MRVRRRALQLKRLSRMESAPVRGNVQTRLRKLDEGAVLRPGAGRRRTQAAGAGGADQPVLYAGGDAPRRGQGILAVQARAGDGYPWLDGFRDADATDCLLAERAFVRARWTGGCSIPVAAHATAGGRNSHVTGMDECGRRARPAPGRSRAAGRGAGGTGRREN